MEDDYSFVSSSLNKQVGGEKLVLLAVVMFFGDLSDISPSLYI